MLRGPEQARTLLYTGPRSISWKQFFAETTYLYNHFNVCNMLNIIFVCTGNICRSPMAEGFLRYKWHGMERGALFVSSMGIHGVTDSPATEHAQAVCRKNGFDISSHRARCLVGEELLRADLILCMEPVQKKFVQVFFPWRRDRVALLTKNTKRYLR